MFLFELLNRKFKKFKFVNGKAVYSKAVCNGDLKTIRIEKKETNGKVVVRYVNPKKLVEILK